MSKLLLDTNVLMYAMDGQSRYHASAVAILTDPTYEMAVSTKVVSEFFAVCSKLKIPLGDAQNFYREVKGNVEILFPDAASLCHFEELIQTYQPRGNRVFDLEIVSVAMANGISEIATANLSDFQEVTEIEVVPLIAE
ncbi:MAG: PIN domain-containing protein [Bacteroidota bacterium]